MNSKQAAILKQIFATPIPSDIKWRDVENLLKSLDAVITEGNGSRVRVMLNGVKAVFHEPHPTGKAVCKCTVEDLRIFFEKAGIVPD